MKKENVKITDKEYDISHFMKGIMDNFANTNNEAATQMLLRNERWRELQDLEQAYTKLLKEYGGIRELFFQLTDIESEMQNIYGDACYLAGIREGINFMLWVSGEKNAQVYSLEI